ncbi:MAG TPA: hypothetical protein VLK82_13675, partial [Candidatus Tectomicrobia bacterium]|nr:hypothetical protein [Candidatus Tectomicrobia bacterium]
MRGGTYTGSGLSAVNSGTSWAAPVRVAGYPGETVIIDSSTTVRLGKEDSYIIFENMIWHRGGQSVEVFQEMPHHIRFKDLEVRYNNSSALRSCHDCEYINLNVHHNGSDGKDHGIYN